MKQLIRIQVYLCESKKKKKIDWPEFIQKCIIDVWFIGLIACFHVKQDANIV